MATANLSYDELSFGSRLNAYLIRDISQGEKAMAGQTYLSQFILLVSIDIAIILAGYSFSENWEIIGMATEN